MYDYCIFGQKYKTNRKFPTLLPNKIDVFSRGNTIFALYLQPLNSDNMHITLQYKSVVETLSPDTTLVAVSKTHPVEAIQELYDAGHSIFGESRPQELVAKYNALPKDIQWHMIGHLQTNKVKYIAPFVSMIHSLDSERLALEIQKQAAKSDRVIDVLLEIHIAQEQSKSGWRLEELISYIKSAPFALMPNIRVRGVMGIATFSDDEELVRSEFLELKRIYELLKQYFDSSFDTISMGMSDDYPLAIECGSNMIRVGSRIFGNRTYAPTSLDE